MQHSGASSYSSLVVRTSPRLIVLGHHATLLSPAVHSQPAGYYKYCDGVLKASITSLNLPLSGRLAFKTWFCQLKLRFPCGGVRKLRSELSRSPLNARFGFLDQKRTSSDAARALFAQVGYPVLPVGLLRPRQKIRVGIGLGETGIMFLDTRIRNETSIVGLFATGASSEIEISIPGQLRPRRRPRRSASLPQR